MRMENRINLKGQLSPEKRLEELEQRVKRLEKVGRTRRPKEDHYAEYIGKLIKLDQLGGLVENGKLIDTTKFTLKIQTDNGDKTLNKGTITSVSLIR
jgi:hypothetical protein